MAEPTLALDYTQLAAHVGAFAGWGRGAQFGDPAWSASKMLTLDDCVRSGCRKVYKCTPPYDWSWLHLFTTVAFPANSTYVQLPSDCAGIEGDIIVAVPGTNAWSPRVMVMNPGFVRELYARVPTAVGYPQVAAVEQQRGTTAVAGQQERLTVYPAADQLYNLSFQYYVVPDAPCPPAPQGANPGTVNPYYPGIATGNPYVYGGAEHAELFLEACLAVFEQRQNDMVGVHTQLFQAELASSIAADRRSKAQHLGMNADRSDEQERGNRWYPQFPPQVTYNGQTYD